MKKLILFVVLLFSLTISAQEVNTSVKQQIVKTYTKALVDGVWYESKPLRVFYHYNGESDKVKMYFNDKLSTYKQQGQTLRGATENGEQFQLLTLVDLETNSVVYLQYFENHYDYGIRLVFSEGLSIQFVEQ